MNVKPLLTMVCTIMLSAACTQLGRPLPSDLQGDPAPISAATRTIVITPDTKYVNVTGGEIVKFLVGDKAFAWNFDGAEYVAPFDLAMAAPLGVLDHKVTTYVDPNPLYLGVGIHNSHGGHGGNGGGHGGK